MAVVTSFCPTILEETTPGVCRWRIVTHRSSLSRCSGPGSGRIGGIRPRGPESGASPEATDGVLHEEADWMRERGAE
ncbi:hypothetical protein BKH32_04505 [Actinomyces oris]|uniref:Uncharacterized protein n=1 Tax=Actinomyces oris TaxID=544580 RepID=A0A1Q8W3T4_9ACTO|nr:hypothetical protein BKH32_04505 [Actinomyces oris]OLO56724.1 hypothetical protein BKH30_01175 [Actinomyces oris]